MATFAEGTLERGLNTSGPARPSGEALSAEPGRPRRHRRRHRAGPARHGPPAPRASSFASRPEFAAALKGNIASGTRHSNTLRANLIYVAVPVASGGRVRGAVRITYPTSTLDARVRRYWLLLAAIGGVVLAAATVVGLRFARTLTEPSRRSSGLPPPSAVAISRHQRRPTPARRRSGRSPRSSTRRSRASTPCSARSRTSSPTPPTS